VRYHAEGPNHNETEGFIMAKKSIPSASAKSLAETSAPEFFSFNGKYLVAPSTSAADLYNDIGCWLECAQEIVSTAAHGLEEKGGAFAANPAGVAKLLYGAGNLLTMIKGALSAFHEVGRVESA